MTQLEILYFYKRLYTQSDLDYQWLDCSNNYASIIGETDQYFYAQQNGSYAVETSINGVCIDTSECNTLYNFNIENERIDQPKISVYPNKNTLVIQSEMPFRGDIFNLKGQRIKTFNKENNTHLSLNFYELPGIYFLHIIKNNKRYQTIKFTKIY